jgi:glycerol-3-phosphate acyltransferase PlsY
MLIKVLVAWVGAYVLGSIPSGIFWAWIAKHIDVREHGSGRTGGTNVWRTAGFLPALLTAVSDALKGVAAIWLARVMGLGLWAEAIAGTMSIVGHNYSLFLKFKGGAGTGTSVGVSSALWITTLPILLVSGVVMGLLAGHASMASILIALLLPAVFALRGDVAYAIGFGVFTMLLTLWALRPNIQRLFKREERFLPIYVNKPPLIRISHYPPDSK